MGTAVFDPERETVYPWIAFAVFAGSASKDIPIGDAVRCV